MRSDALQSDKKDRYFEGTSCYHVQDTNNKMYRLVKEVHNEDAMEKGDKMAGPGNGSGK